MTRKKELIRLLTLLAVSLGAACLIVFFMVRSGSLRGQTIERILLSPRLIEAVKTRSEQEKNVPLRFGGIEFSFFDDKSQSQRTVSVDQATYQTFYNAISHLSETTEPPPEVVHAFSRGKRAVLTLRMALQDDKKGFQPFEQRVEWSLEEPDWFRVDVGEKGEAPLFVWFYDKGSYTQTLSLFTSF